MPTKQQLQAENERLTEENEALRDLLGAARAYAGLPHPADYGDRLYPYETERRLDRIAVWANGGREDMDPRVYLLVIGDRARHLREEAARPVRYEVRAAPLPVPAVEPGDELVVIPAPDAAAVLAGSITSGTPLVVVDESAGPEYPAVGTPSRREQRRPARLHGRHLRSPGRREQVARRVPLLRALRLRRARRSRPPRTRPTASPPLSWAGASHEHPRHRPSRTPAQPRDHQLGNRLLGVDPETLSTTATGA